MRFWGTRFSDKSVLFHPIAWVWTIQWLNGDHLEPSNRCLRQLWDLWETGTNPRRRSANQEVYDSQTLKTWRKRKGIAMDDGWWWGRMYEVKRTQERITVYRFKAVWANSQNRKMLHKLWTNYAFWNKPKWVSCWWFDAVTEGHHHHIKCKENAKTWNRLEPGSFSCPYSSSGSLGLTH